MAFKYEKYKIEAKTIPELFMKRVERDPQRIAFVHVHKGKWTSVNYKDYYEQVKEVSFGLASMGLEKGDAIVIWANNRAEWYYADMGTTLIGGMPIGVYQSSTAEQGTYMVNHSSAKFLVVEGQEELDKALEQLDNMPTVEAVFAIEHVEMNHPKVRRFQDLYEMGKDLQKEKPDLIQERIKLIDPDEIVTLVYTSGTTGPPKGVMLSHANCLYCLEHFYDFLPVDSSAVTVAFLPLCHIGGRIGGYYVNIYSGMTPVLAESWEELLFNLSEVRPTFIATTPRIIEKFHSMAQTLIDDAPKLQQIAAGWAENVGVEVSRLKQKGMSPSTFQKIKYFFADIILFRRIRDLFGGKIQYFVSGGAPIAKELIEYFHAVGILILESYGQTELTGNVIQNRAENYRFGSVGNVFPGSEIKLAEDGEILYKGPAACMGYHKEPEATKELIDEEGYLHTGDVGRVDEDGFYYITDRKKDIMITAAGKNISPQNIENLLKTSKYISHACVFGDRRKYLTAVITLDEDESLKYARDNKIIFKDLRDLTTKPEIIKLISDVVKERNEKLHRVEQLKKFRILKEELDQDDAEITSTMKIKRRILYERHKHLVESMYKGK